MARVTLVPNPLIINGGLVDPLGVLSVAGAGNGFTVAAPGRRSLFFRVYNATAGAGTVSILAGSFPLAPSSGLGPVTAPVGAAGTSWIGPVDSARCIQADGSLTIETSAAMTVTAFTIDGKYVG